MRHNVVSFEILSKSVCVCDCYGAKKNLFSRNRVYLSDLLGQEKHLEIDIRQKKDSLRSKLMLFEKASNGTKH